jgi:hypothetical protein
MCNNGKREKKRSTETSEYVYKEGTRRTQRKAYTGEPRINEQVEERVKRVERKR